MKTNLFIYWKNENIDFDDSKIDKKTFNVIIGPSKSEHEYLKSVSRYYRSADIMKKYSFCSDVWRLWKLSENKGLYIDASVEIGPRINTFMDQKFQNDTCLFRGNYKYIESGIMYSGIKHNSFFRKMFDFYKNETTNISYFIMPVFLSKLVFESGIEFGWEPQTSKGLKVYPLPMIRDKNTLWKTGIGSWGRNAKPDDASYFDKKKNDIWLPWEQKYINRDSASKYNQMVEMAMNGIDIDIDLLRKLYEDKGSKVLRSSFEDDYKMIKSIVPFSKKMFWLKIYVFFAKEQ